MSYKLGTIYKIVCLSNPDIQYIGSTFDKLNYRWENHKGSYQGWLKRNTTACSIYPYFEAYGVENFEVIKIKEYLCYQENDKDRKHLESKEQLWISKLKCVNKVNPFRIEKMSSKKYRETNKEEINEKQRKKYEENKKEIKEKRKEKVTCDCGSVVRKDSLTRHKKSKKHQDFIKNN